MQRFLDVSERAGVGLVRVGASLKRPQTIRDDSEQHLLRDAVDASFADRPVLEQDLESVGTRLERSVRCGRLI